MSDEARRPDWTISVISHGHVNSVRLLMSDFARWLDPARHEVILTINVPEPLAAAELAWKGALTVIRNHTPRGFAANHNAAARHGSGTRIAFLDPDLRLAGDPFSDLQSFLDSPAVGLVAPRVVDDAGTLQDNCRRLVTPLALVRRYALRALDAYGAPETAQCTEWIAGLFVAISRSTFERLGGFDEHYHLYCEDTDLSLRAWNQGLRVLAAPCKSVTHLPRRQTLRNPRHFGWHCASLLRLWSSRSFWRYLTFGRGCYYSSRRAHGAPVGPKESVELSAHK